MSFLHMHFALCTIAVKCVNNNYDSSKFYTSGFQLQIVPIFMNHGSVNNSEKSLVHPSAFSEFI